MAAWTTDIAPWTGVCNQHSIDVDTLQWVKADCSPNRQRGANDLYSYDGLEGGQEPALNRLKRGDVTP